FGVFHTILVHLGPFGCFTNLGAKRCCVGILHNKRTRSTPLDSKIMFCCLSKLDAKWAELVQKFVPRSRIGIFHNERTRSTPLDPKLMFYGVSYHLGAFGTIMLPYETRGKTGRTSAKVRATNSCQNFSQRTHSIHSIGP